jgi:hypothetical protein
VSPLSLAYSAVIPKVCAIWWNYLLHVSETLKSALTVMTLFGPGIFNIDMHSEELPWIMQMLVVPGLHDIVMASP